MPLKVEVKAGAVSCPLFVYAEPLSSVKPGMKFASCFPDGGWYAIHGMIAYLWFKRQ